MLLTGLGYTGGNYDRNRRISLGDIARSNGAADALWCARCLDWKDIAVRRAVISGALMPSLRRVVVHTTDVRVHDAVEALARWCNGDDTVDLKAAAAGAAAGAAAAAAERERQRQDIIDAFPPVALASN